MKCIQVVSQLHGLLWVHLIHLHSCHGEGLRLEAGPARAATLAGLRKSCAGASLEDPPRRHGDM
jgi:hypothetical protein